MTYDIDYIYAYENKVKVEDAINILNQIKDLNPNKRIMLIASFVYEPLNNELFIKKIKDLNMIYVPYKRYARMPIMDISIFYFTGLIRLKAHIGSWL